MAKLAKPKPLYRTVLYFSFIPLCNIAPTIDPAMIVHVLTIVPSIFSPIGLPCKINVFIRIVQIHV